MSTTTAAIRTSAVPAASRTSRVEGSASFAAALEAPRRPSPVAAAAQSEVAAIQAHEARIDDLIAGGRTGSLSDVELLRLQASIYDYSARVDVATRVVDRAAGGLRQLLSIQV
jgi:hypothetical protein